MFNIDFVNRNYMLPCICSPFDFDKINFKPDYFLWIHCKVVDLSTVQGVFKKFVARPWRSRKYKGHAMYENTINQYKNIYIIKKKSIQIRKKKVLIYHGVCSCIPRCFLSPSHYTFSPHTDETTPQSVFQGQLCIESLWFLSFQHFWVLQIGYFKDAMLLYCL